MNWPPLFVLALLGALQPHSIMQHTSLHVRAVQTIAHRGLFHDINDEHAIAENTISALQRAADFGLAGVELDVRLSSDGVPMVTHDKIANRATIKDNASGALNPIDVAMDLQDSATANPIAAHLASYWNHAPLKVYGRNGKILSSNETHRMETLEAIIDHLKSLNLPKFLVFLDLQDPPTLRAAAAIVKRSGMDNQVILKFYAKSAMDSSQYKFTNFQTCANVARGEGLLGLQIVPQFNNGELTTVGGRAYIEVFQTRLSVTEYLSCWFDAQSAYGGSGSALVPIVSASVPAKKQAAWNAAADALMWATANGRATMSIVSMPDAGRNTGRRCKLFSFRSKEVPAKKFSRAAHDAKKAFAIKYLGAQDYVIVDLMGDVKSHTYRSDLGFFRANLC